MRVGILGPLKRAELSCHGASYAFNKHFTLDVYVMRQKRRSHPPRRHQRHRNSVAIQDVKPRLCRSSSSLLEPIPILSRVHKPFDHVTRV